MTRINKYVAQASGISRRAADAAIAEGRVLVNGTPPTAGHGVQPADTVTLDGRVLEPPKTMQSVMFNKPAGYVVSRDGQGSQTIYDALPAALHHLKPVGRLDKNSSGLLLLTNDGVLANELTHPSRGKEKVYEILLDRPLMPLHRQMIGDHGVLLDDGTSRLQLERLPGGDDTAWRVRMHEGRNRQIRRTFKAVGYTVRKLHRTQFGPYSLEGLRPGDYRAV
jgi:23S rRNA pseudouridine2605 synthase